MSAYAVVIAARMSSERLPGKALVSYCPGGVTTNLEQIVQRWRWHSDRGPAIMVATTTGSEDDPIAKLCRTIEVPCYRGSRENVLERMDQALRLFVPDAAYVARGMSDSPLVDVEMADARLDVLVETSADGLLYNGDSDRITYAGTTDVWSRAAWNTIVAESSGEECEHPGKYYWDNLSKFAAVGLPLPRREYLAQGVRTELDTPDDLKMLRELWAMGNGEWGMRNGKDNIMPTLDALKYLIEHPSLAAINAGVPVKTQAHAHWRKGRQWLCEHCQAHNGSIVAGDLIIRCAHCGRPRKFYANKPRASMMSY